MFYHRIKLHSRNCKVISITIFSMSEFYEHTTFKASSLDEAIEYANKNDMVVIEKYPIIKYMTPNYECSTSNIEYLVLDNDTIRGEFSTYQEAEKFVESLIKSYYTFEPSKKRRNKAREFLILLKKIRSHDYVFGKDVEKDDSFEPDLEEYVYSKEFHDQYQQIVIGHHF